MDGQTIYSVKRWLRILDSRWTQKTAEVQFEEHRLRLYSTYWWSDVSQPVFESEIVPYFTALGSHFKPSVIIDVGAASGHFALMAARLFPGATIHAFEPSERQGILLSRNAKLNQIGNLQIQPLGLWNRADQLAFRTNGAESSIESVSRFRGRLPFLEKVTVLPLDQWARNARPGKIDLIKMDAEGAEIEILEGAQAVLQRDRPQLLVQAYHLRDGVRTLEPCASILQKLGYDTREFVTGSGLLHAKWPEHLKPQIARH